MLFIAKKDQVVKKTAVIELPLLIVEILASVEVEIEELAAKAGMKRKAGMLII